MEMDVDEWYNKKNLSKLQFTVSVLLSVDQTRTQAHRKFYFTWFLMQSPISIWFGLNIP